MGTGQFHGSSVESKAFMNSLEGTLNDFDTPYQLFEGQNLSVGAVQVRAKVFESSV